ncbi:hypothetical protein BT93_C1441 [Corymbia citriodora subsp. variegata]|nr:hypothetical protein BT93_C1441 [Corymbia citriodora subsp. variegata]
MPTSSSRPSLPPLPSLSRLNLVPSQAPRQLAQRPTSLSPSPARPAAASSSGPRDVIGSSQDQESSKLQQNSLLQIKRNSNENGEESEADEYLGDEPAETAREREVELSIMKKGVENVKRPGLSKAMRTDMNPSDLRL